MSLRYEALKILSDGAFHSGVELGARLGVTRTAVWKHIRALGELGLDIYAVGGKGYRLAQPLEWLDAETIHAAVADDVRPLLRAIEVHTRLDSTNTHLVKQAASGLASGHACLAEYQDAGRGRRGRNWISPFGANIYFSLLWRFTLDPAQMSGLGLAVGVGIVRALQAAGLDGLTLKWPNDILCNGRKLAGTLLEMSGESFGTCNVVIGIGLNCRMPERAGTGIDQPWTDVESALGRSASRNALAAHLLTHCVRVLHAFQHAGLAPFLTEWQQYDAARGKTVSLRLPTEIITGTAAGIDPSGALLLTRNGTTQRYLAGEISLRLA